MDALVPPPRELEAAITDALERDAIADLQQLLVGRQSADIADVIDRLSPLQRAVVLTQLPPPAAALVLAETSGETQRGLLATLPPAFQREVVGHLAIDDLTRLLLATPDHREEVLAELDLAVAREVSLLLEYPVQSAGRLMTNKFVRLLATMTAQEAIDYLRQHGPGFETFTDLYVIERGDVLVGVISLRQLVLAPADQPIRNFMTTDIITVEPTADQEVAAKLLARYNFLALPVVQNQRILGVITVDDIIDVLIDEGTEDQLRFGAVEPGAVNHPYFGTPVWRVVRSRVGWLVLLFVAETATGSVLRLFESELATVVALAFFIPLLIGTGGNTGTQTVSTIIRGLALNEIRLRDAGRVLARECASGALLGILLGTIAFGRAFFLWDSGGELSLVVALSIVAICTWANTIASLIPLLALRLKVDPALVSAPLITTLVDATGLAIYLLIAKALLSSL